MIKEIAQFIDTLDPDFKTLGLKPKEGLHILLRIQKEDGRVFSDEDSMIGWAFTRKKDQEPEKVKLLEYFATLTTLTWCVNTNKCFDLPVKAIHSCSPYSIALKRENLINGEKYLLNKKDNKSQVYERISAYFNKGFDLLDDENQRQRLEIFKQALNGEQNFHQWLDRIPEYAELKDSDYVIFYLDEPIESYEKANSKYLADKLFNTNEYDEIIDEVKYGTSDFFNGFPTKKPFLLHQTATFDIAGRITSGEARALFEFKALLGRGILPRPLPLFIYDDELKGKSIALFKKNADDGEKISYKQIIETLYSDHKRELENYYLLFYQQGEIKDFDFVSKFDYELKGRDNENWVIEDLFNAQYRRSLENVFDLEYHVLIPVLNNALITKTKSGDFQRKYFDEIDSKYCKSANTYLMVMTHRKAFYDFIYKSKRQAISAEVFDGLMQTLVLDDIRLDEVKGNQHSQNLNIRQKLNIWFSLSEKFNQKHLNPNITMASKLQAHRAFMQQLTQNQAGITTDDEYAFTIGQVIYYLFSKSKTADRSYQRLEAFLQQVKSQEMNKAVARLFDLYKHEVFSKNFRTPFAEVMDYETKANLRDFIPTILAGFFSDNQLFGNKENGEQQPETTEE